MTLNKDKDLFSESGILLNKTNKVPKEDEILNAISKRVRKLSTVLTVFSVKEPKDSQVQVTKRLFTHFGKSLNARIQPLKYSTGEASQLYRNLPGTGEQLDEKTN